MSKVIDWIYDHTWAITEPALETIISIANRDRNDLSALLSGEGPEIDTTALSAKLGQPLGASARAEIRDGVAVIPVHGPIFPRANLFTQISGATSLQVLALDFNTALELDDAKAILFDIDTPGGQVNGTSEFVDMVYSARGRKPIMAYVQGMAASGGMWIASAVDKIVISDTAILGSIGVLAAARDTSQRDAAEGVRKIDIVSSVSPKKKLDPASDEGRAEIQGIVDQLAGVMVASIARNRGVSPATVISDFGKGSVFVGAQAVDQGLADRLGSMESVLAELKESNSSQSRRGAMNAAQVAAAAASDAAAAAAVTTTMTVEAVRDTSPATYQAIFALGQTQGVTEGATAERERIQSIESIKAPGFEALIDEQKYNPEATRQSVAEAVLTQQETQRTTAAAATTEDATAVAAAAAKVEQEATDGDEADVDQAVALMTEGGNEHRGFAADGK
jgi:ClpP class serine protease